MQRNWWQSLIYSIDLVRTFCCVIICPIQLKIKHSEDTKKTRKSSCVNAIGIPTAVYQVFHLLPKVGYPPPRSDMGVYLRWGTPSRGTPQPGLMGDTWGGVFPSWTWSGYPSVWTWPGYPPVRPHWDTHHLDLVGVPLPCEIWLRYPPIWTWPGTP